MKKTITMVSIVLLIITLFTSCGDGGLNGIYVAKNPAAKQSMYSKFIFNGGKVKVIMGAMGIEVPGGYEYGFKREGNKVSIELGIPGSGLSLGGIELYYDEECDEIRLLLGGELGTTLNENAPVWCKKEKDGNCKCNIENPNPKEEKATPVERVKNDKNDSTDKKGGLWDIIKNLFSSDFKSNKKESEFDRNNIAYVYIVNESYAVPIIVWKAGHNFIMFKDKNGNGAVYSYGPVEPNSNNPARMYVGTFSEDNFIKSLESKNFILKAERAKVEQQKILDLVPWRFSKTEKEVYDTNVNQEFDRYVKFTVSESEGKKMIDAADSYLLSYPEYSVFGIGLKQCDNMTSEIAGAGELGYVVLNSPNLSFDNILYWKEIKKRKFVEQYPQ